PSDITLVNTLPVTAPARTAFDLARQHRVADAHTEEPRRATAADCDSAARGAEKDNDGLAPESEVDLYVGGDVYVRQ
ncbi:MAG TPA: hypothetical protein VE132_15970, partial [Micromonosporaceae bacterium]|nr:hypothetical protein [Micromonosporaceae bacterium]